MGIRILPPHIAAMIAAGEVIDRPASALRELLDNSIDAGATSISVTCRGDKAQYLIVEDNGRGMTPDDLGLCLQHHATSKLETNRIHDIKTLGFRGEALASIAAVSTVSVISRPKDQDVAFQIASRAGQKGGSVRPSAGGYGTRVVVDDLFFNHPARMKFLKSERTEKAWISEIVERAAFCRPDVEFSLQMGNSRRRFPAASTFSRMRLVLADDIGEDALTADLESGDISAFGVVPLPGSLNERSGRQIIAVNGRVVSDKAVIATVSSVYKSLIGAKGTPSFGLHIQLPFDQVDVNVHPQKSEVRFFDEAKVYNAVRDCVSKALSNAGMKTPSSVFKMAMQLSAPKSIEDVMEDRRRLPLGKFLGQANSKWIISETADGIILIDQHAAHERVILERLKSALYGGDQSMISVSPPLTRTLSAMNASKVADALEPMKKLGFSVRMQGDTLVMEGYPGVLAGVVPEELIDSAIDAILRNVTSGIIAENVWETLATAACKAAIKAGNNLDEERADKLLREIEATPNAAECNHGRPTMVILKDADIAKLFAR